MVLLLQELIVTYTETKMIIQLIIIPLSTIYHICVNYSLILFDNVKIFCQVWISTANSYLRFLYVCSFKFYYKFCLINQFIIVSYILSGVAVSIVIITNFLFKHWLDTTSHIVNLVKLIFKVLNYARKNKYPLINRSALTYWEENYPSRLDLGKEKYGGPFTEEQVENVKVVIRLAPMFICIIGHVCSEDIEWITYYKSDETLSFLTCLLNKNSLYTSVALLLILFYQLIINPCFYNYIPSIPKRIGIGLVFLSTYSVISLACKDHLFDTTSDKAAIVSQALFGISFVFIFPTSLVFTIAQSPHEMRSLMVGLWCAAHGVGYVINLNNKYLFACEEDTASQSLLLFHI